MVDLASDFLDRNTPVFRCYQIFACKILAGRILDGQIPGVIKYSWTKKPVFMYYNFVDGHSDPDFEVFVGRDDVCFFISQSGETADTLGALRSFIKTIPKMQQS